MAIATVDAEACSVTSWLSLPPKDVTGMLLMYLTRTKQHLKYWMDVLAIIQTSLSNNYKMQLLNDVRADGSVTSEYLSILLGMSCNLPLIEMYIGKHSYHAKLIVFGLACKNRADLMPECSVDLHIISYKLAVVMGLIHFGDFGLYQAAYEDYNVFGGDVRISEEEIMHYLPVSERTGSAIIAHITSAFPNQFQNVFVRSSIANDNVEYIMQLRHGNVIGKLRLAINHDSYNVMGWFASILRSMDDTLKMLAKYGNTAALEVILSHLTIPIDYKELLIIAIQSKWYKMPKVILKHWKLACDVGAPVVDEEIMTLLYGHYNWRLCSMVLKVIDPEAYKVLNAESMRGGKLFEYVVKTIRNAGYNDASEIAQAVRNFTKNPEQALDLLLRCSAFATALPPWLDIWCDVIYTHAKDKVAIATMIDRHGAHKFSMTNLKVALGIDAELVKLLYANLVRHGVLDAAAMLQYIEENRESGMINATCLAMIEDDLKNKAKVE